MALTSFAGTRRYIFMGLSAILLLVFSGCATVPKPVTIKHERAPSLSDAAMPNQQYRPRPVEPAGQSIGDLVDLLKRKNVISADEAARFTVQSVVRAAAEKGTAPGPEGVAALAALLQSKNVISADEAVRFTEQYVARAPEGRGAALVEINDKERIEKITASITQELKQGLWESEKEQVEMITARVTEELRKSLQEQVKSGVRQELTGETRKAEAVAGGKDTGAYEKEQFEELKQKVSYAEQRLAELLHGGKIAELAANAPEWAKKIRFGGDVRLRYESDRFDKKNFNEFTRISQGVDTQQLQNSWADQHSFKYRVRAGVEADVSENLFGNEKLQAVVRVATGNTSNPVSTNTLLGDNFNKDNILLDQAYLKFSWKTLSDAPTVYTIYGGRMPNPWFSSELVWDGDLNFEGLALNVKKPLTDTESWVSSLTAGAFPLQQSDPAGIFDFSQHGKWLLGGQAVLERKSRVGISAKAGAAYYKFKNITGLLNEDVGRPGATDWSAPLFSQKGNSLFFIDPSNSSKVGLASEFRELNLTGNLDIGFRDYVVYSRGVNA